MPNIAEIKKIGGNVWVRIGKAGEFVSGIALWTPDEQKQNYDSGFRDGYEAAKEEVLTRVATGKSIDTSII